MKLPLLGHYFALPTAEPERVKLPLLGHYFALPTAEPEPLTASMWCVHKVARFGPGCLFRMKFETRPDWPTEQDEGLA